jgi:hypothetical protein
MPKALGAAIGCCCIALLPVVVAAHNVSASNANFIGNVDGPAIPLFLYLGAKHMVTGYDHLLYLLAVVFLLVRPRQVVGFVTLFAVGHSITLIAGVMLGWQVNASLVDAVIGFSVAYKAFENLEGFETFFGMRPNMSIAVFAFGLVHGLGLATKLQAVYSGGPGMLVNLIGFNLGVEIGQLIALALLLAVLGLWRARASFASQAYLANAAIMTCGFMFAGYHLVVMRMQL